MSNRLIWTVRYFLFDRSLLTRMALIWTVAVVIGSFLPFETKEAIGTETRSLDLATHQRATVVHQTGHLIAFGIDALLLAAAWPKNAHHLYSFLFVVVLGAVIEYAQYKIGGGKLFEWWDVRDDALAAAVGCLIGTLLKMNQKLRLRS